MMINHRGYAAIGLFNTKTEHNIGGVLRAASCYDVKLVAIQGKRYKHLCTDTTRAYKHIPLCHTNNLRDIIPFNCVPVGVEIVPSAKSIINYQHPEAAFYIFGPEDGSISSDILDFCRDVIYIPTRYCMNLAATTNVVLYDRMMKGCR